MDFREDAVLLIVLIGVVYFIVSKLAPSIGSGISAAATGLKNAAVATGQATYNAATGNLTSGQIATIAQQSTQGVLGSNATPAQIAAVPAAEQEVTNFANWSMPLSFGFGAGSTSSDTPVPGTGYTIYQLRELGYQDSDIVGLFQEAGIVSADDLNNPNPSLDTVTSTLASGGVT